MVKRVVGLPVRDDIVGTPAVECPQFRSGGRDCLGVEPFGGERRRLGFEELAHPEALYVLIHRNLSNLVGPPT